jgi:hypothetical protein
VASESPAGRAVVSELDGRLGDLRRRLHVPGGAGRARIGLDRTLRLTRIPHKQLGAYRHSGTFAAGIALGLKAVGVTGSAAAGFVVLARCAMFVPVTVFGMFLLVRDGGCGRVL